MLEISLLRIQRAEQLATRTLEKLPEKERESRARLQEMLDFHNIAHRTTQDVIREWSSRKRGGR